MSFTDDPRATHRGGRPRFADRLVKALEDRRQLIEGDVRDYADTRNCGDCSASGSNNDRQSDERMTIASRSNRRIVLRLEV